MTPRLGGLVGPFGLALLVATALQAQSDPHKVPKRPRLDADRDTNAAASYFYYGSSQLPKYPEQAAAGFYWASRLDPYWADPLYGRYVALLLAQPTHILTNYLLHRENLRKDPQIRAIDSLKYQALLRNPFVDRRLDGVLLESWLQREFQGVVNVRDLRRVNPTMAAWLAYTHGRFQESVDEYAQALTRFPGNPGLRLSRALAFVALGLHDSALASVRIAIDTLRGSPDDAGGYSYESYPYAEYSLGVLFEQVRSNDSAKAAFERALLDDITFYPAHRKLARIRLSAGDTLGALKELNDAVTLAPNDVVGLFELGRLSVTAGKVDSGMTLLLRAVATEPLFLQPHLTLGMMYERSGFVDEAIEEYTTVVRLAPRSMDAQSVALRQRVEKLRTAPR